MFNLFKNIIYINIWNVYFLVFMKKGLTKDKLKASRTTNKGSILQGRGN